MMSRLGNRLDEKGIVTKIKDNAKKYLPNNLWSAIAGTFGLIEGAGIGFTGGTILGAGYYLMNEGFGYMANGRVLDALYKTAETGMKIGSYSALALGATGFLLLSKYFRKK